MRRIEPVVERTFTECMEQLQEGYVASVAAAAGCLMLPVTRDRFGMDVMLVRTDRADEEEVSVYAQLKNTTTLRVDPCRDTLSYQFGHRDHMQRLVNPRTGIKAILVVMATRPEQRLWAVGDHDGLTVAHCCYWASLEGMTVPEGVERPSVRLKTSNTFTADALTGILDRLERGEAIDGGP